MAGSTRISPARPGLSQFQAIDFAGGLNIRDAASEVGDNESPDCMNITLDERGGVVKRLGLATLTTSLSNPPSNLFSSQVLALDIVQDGATVKKTSDWVTLTVFKTFSTTARCGMSDFGGKLILVHPIDGLFTYDGTTLAAVGTGPKGTACVGWQGKLHVIGDPANTRRVWASGIQDPTDWNEAGAGGAYHNDIREGAYADSPLTAIGAGQGMDVSGRPGLLVYKERSVHRIYSSSGTTAGAYTTLAVQAGCSGPLALTSLLGRTISVNPDGLWETDGVQAPILVSARLSPLFTTTQLDQVLMANVAAGTIGQRAVFSLPWKSDLFGFGLGGFGAPGVFGGGATTTNTLTLEYNPLVGWIVPHDFGMACYATNYRSTQRLLGGDTSYARVSTVFSGWDDNANPITSRYQTRWFALNSGDYARLRRIRLAARGSFALSLKRDYEDDVTEARSVAATGDAATWGSGAWGVGVTGLHATAESFPVDLNDFGICRTCSLLFEESSSISAYGKPLLQTGLTPQVGSFALYGFQTQFVPLGGS